MSDEATRERHARHETWFQTLDTRVDGLEAIAQKAELWRYGNGQPHRGAEARITRLEAEAIMVRDVDKIVAAALKQQGRSAVALAKTIAPYAILTAGVVLYLASGGRIQVSP